MNRNRNVDKYASVLLKQNMPKNSPVVVEPNYPAYGQYVALFQNNGIMNIDLSCIRANTIDMHFNSILSILRDGIETDQVQNMKIYGTYEDGIRVPFSIFDYFINLIFWYLPTSCGDKLTSKFFIYEKDGFTQNSIKSYIDELFLEPHRTEYPNIWLNQIIDNAVFKFKYIDEFSNYFMNTFNNEDTITLMNMDKEFYDAIHCDTSNLPMEDVKKVGMDATYKAIERIKASGFHWAKPYFEAKQGINIKQFREFQINVGTKPDGNGNIFPAIINKSYSNGAVNTLQAMVMDAEVARVAQILQKNNVGTSGAMARVMGINNIDTRMYPDPRYVCNSKNFVSLEIKDEQTLMKLKNRYFRLSRNGVEQKIPSNPMKMKALIGRTILLRSPITCASHAAGKGYCYRCYGDLAYTNSDFNPGKFAAEELSSQLTQRLLSAKHLLEASVREMKWVDEFYGLLTVECNVITLIEGADYKKFKLIINADSIEGDEELDSFEYSVYVKSFGVQLPNGKVVDIHTENYDDIYIAKELGDIISRKKVNDDGNYVINMEHLGDTGLFLIKISNIELSQALDDVIACIDRQSVINSLKTKDAILQKLLSDVNRSGLDTESVHLEVLLSNQVRRKNDILLNPEWEYENEDYQMIALKDALTNHPAICISLEYNKLAKALYNPLSFRKRKASVADLFYMTQPQNYMSYEPVETVKTEDDEMVKPFIIQQDPNFVPESSIDDEGLDAE